MREHGSLVVFCCSRSGALAAQEARTQGLPLPRQMHLVELTCLGQLSELHILNALYDGAEKVLVLACYESNCASPPGSNQAERKVSLAKEMLNAIGTDPGRVRFERIAAVMGARFATLVQETYGGDGS